MPLTHRLDQKYKFLELLEQHMTTRAFATVFQLTFVLSVLVSCKKTEESAPLPTVRFTEPCTNEMVTGTEIGTYEIGAEVKRTVPRVRYDNRDYFLNMVSARPLGWDCNDWIFSYARELKRLGKTQEEASAMIRAKFGESALFFPW